MKIASALKLASVLAVSALILPSCAKSSPPEAEFSRVELGSAMGVTSGDAKLFSLAPASPAAKSDEARAVADEPLSGNGGQPIRGQGQDKRKLIKTGNVSLESRDLDGAEAKIASMAKELGGYVAASSKSETYLSMAIRVPQDRFDAAMGGLKAAGRLKSRSESVEDVTLQYVDSESRIATKKILKERYTEYLKRAGKVEDLLSVERALNDVLSELDSMESSFKALKDQIDYASVSVTVQLPPEAAPAARRSFLGGLLAVWDGFLGFLYVLAYGLVAVLLFGVPSVLLLGLLYWLGFGKIGLVRKYFRFLSGRGRAR